MALYVATRHVVIEEVAENFTNEYTAYIDKVDVANRGGR
jgi:hypothetical protein